jgi:hypothetical protein
MSLAVNKAGTALGGGWPEALAKLVPGEIIVAFAAALDIPGLPDRAGVHLVILGVSAVLTPVVLWASSRHASEKAPWLQHVVRATTLVLFGLGADKTLHEGLGDYRFVPHLGALVVAILGALILAPPGAGKPPPAARYPPPEGARRPKPAPRPVSPGGDNRGTRLASHHLT